MTQLVQEVKVQAHSNFVQFWRNHADKFGEHNKEKAQLIYETAFITGAVEGIGLSLIPLSNTIEKFKEISNA